MFSYNFQSLQQAPSRGECPIHGPLPELNYTAGYNQASLAFTKLPVLAQLTVKTSHILGAGMGAFVTSLIAKGLNLGQFEEKKVTGEDVDSVLNREYAWDVGMMF